jgi:hypothetical protein
MVAVLNILFSFFNLLILTLFLQRFSLSNSLQAGALVLLMFLQLCGSIKLSLTIIAFEWSIIDMSLHVVKKMTLGDKVLRAVITFELPFTVVTSLMNL